jgi:hypothetical protein
VHTLFFAAITFVLPKLLVRPLFGTVNSNTKMFGIASILYDKRSSSAYIRIKLALALVLEHLVILCFASLLTICLGKKV